jgi:Domain of unknown function (DUF1772)
VSSLVIAAAVVGIATAAIIYGTDIFSAVVVRPAAAGAADASVADLLGRVHEYGDRRLPLPGVASIVATAVATAATDSTASRIAGAAALAALLAWLAIYLRVSAPINRQLRAAAATHIVLPQTRSLQRHWDSVIWVRAALQTIALAGLLVIVVAR